jgi:NTP pyrophosphatase (non-canonical NTP hydrolase)
MNLNEYSALARETAVYPKTHGVEYLTLGLINELCEFYPAFLEWIDWCTNDYARVNTKSYLCREKELRNHAILELGDVCWYYVMLCDELDILAANYFDGSTSPVSDKYFILRMGTLAGAIKKRLRDGVTDKGEDDIHSMLTYFAAHITWFASELETTVEDVLIANIQKLKDRKERNTIHGSGDNR